MFVYGIRISAHSIRKVPTIKSTPVNSMESPAFSGYRNTDILNLTDSDQESPVIISSTTTVMAKRRSAMRKGRKSGNQESLIRQKTKRSQLAQNLTPPTATSAQKSSPFVKRKLTQEENQNVLDYICKNKLFESTGRIKTWIALQNSGVVKGRSFQTIRQSFRRSILPRGKLELFTISKKNYNILRRVRSNLNVSSASVSPRTTRAQTKPFQLQNPRSIGRPAKMDKNRSKSISSSSSRASSNPSDTLNLEFSKYTSIFEGGTEHEVITIVEDSSDEEEVQAAVVRPENNREKEKGQLKTATAVRVPNPLVFGENEIIELDDSDDDVELSQVGEIIDIDIADEEDEETSDEGIFQQVVDQTSTGNESQEMSEEEKIRRIGDHTHTNENVQGKSNGEKSAAETVQEISDEEKLESHGEGVNTSDDTSEDGQIVDMSDEEEGQIRDDDEDEEIQVQPPSGVAVIENEVETLVMTDADDDDIEIVEMHLNGSKTGNTNTNSPVRSQRSGRPSRRRQRQSRKKNFRYFNFRILSRSPSPIRSPVNDRRSESNNPQRKTSSHKSPIASSSVTVSEALKRLGKSRWGCNLIKPSAVQNTTTNTSTSRDWSERNYQRAHEVVRVRNGKYRREAYGYRDRNRRFPRFLMTQPSMAPPPNPPPLLGDPTGCDMLPVLSNNLTTHGVVHQPGVNNPNEQSVSVYGMNMYVPPLTQIRGTLRPIVIDGSNVAMSHGLNRVFSCRGIQICVEYFQKLGHETVLAFVPKYRNKASESVDSHLLDELESKGIVRFTPSRELHTGARISSYDDRYVVQCAAAIGGIIVSNDNFRDLLEEQPSWQYVIASRVLQFTWVIGDLIMFPPDPLGRNGPPLTEFLRF